MDLNYTDLRIETLSKGEYAVVWCNNINQYPSKQRDYYVKLILQNLDTQELRIIDRNIKEIPALPLGSIFRDKQLSQDRIGTYFDFSFYVQKPQTSSLLAPELFDDPTSYFGKLNTQIPLPDGHKYNAAFHSKNQQGIHISSNGKTVFFPAYVITQYFYFRSAALIKQIMSKDSKYNDAVHGLYKTIEIDTNGDASIILNPGVSPDDAAEIVRFSRENGSYANKLFHQIHDDLIASHLKNKTFYEQKGWPYKFNTSILKAFFPFTGEVDMIVRGIELNENYYLALEIIEENSVYPFETLTIFREDPNSGRPIEEKKVTKKKKSKNPTNNAVDETPNNQYEDEKVSNDKRDDGRLDLKDKPIQHQRIQKTSEPESAKVTESTDQRVDLSSDHEESDGDDGTAQMNPAYKDLEHPDRETPGLEAFKKMLSIAQETYEGFSYESLIFHCPSKNDSVTSRKKWRRAFLEDNETRRAYIVAAINYAGKKFCAIDIERDARLPRASTLILSMNDSSDVSQNLITSIMNNYVRENQSWLHRMPSDSFQYSTLKHPQDSTDEAIQRWAKRLVDSLRTSSNS